MALPSSGVLTLADIQTEFGGTNPIDLSDYYRGGGLVPDSGPNAAIPTSGAISVSDFYGSANSITLDFTVQGATVNRGPGTYAGVSIGTASVNRMVIIQGGLWPSVPSAITIGGISAGIVSIQQSYIAYAKVPTGTTATIVITGGGTHTTQIYTLNTVNAAPTQTKVQTTNVAANTVQSSTMTQNPVDTEGVFIWGALFVSAGPGSPVRVGSGIFTTNPNGVTTRISDGQAIGNQLSNYRAGYSECTTTDSRNASATFNNNPSKNTAFMYAAFTYFQAN
jgi:hypothetical protein